MTVDYSKVLEKVREKAKSCSRNPNDITLIAVSKNYPVSSIQSAYEEGAREFGESRVQEALEKIPNLPSDCRWHLIGSLQTNKAAKAVSAFHLIHSVDSLHLAQKISHICDKMGCAASILLQVNVSGEQTKHGLSPQEWDKRLEELNNLPHLCVEGLMTIAPLTDDPAVIRQCFSGLRLLRDRWRGSMRDPSIFRHLSMGMTHDYSLAIEEGATLLRIGTAVFGSGG